MKIIINFLFCIFFICTHSSILKFVPHSEYKKNADPVRWALIVAGSNGWDNYRHQADACHAFQIMKKHGLNEDHIILMMYDDIANNNENPTKGVIVNHPNGPNVYSGIQIDYKGKDVTPKNFLDILSGNKQQMKHIGSGKVIESGPNDHIFVNFVDHGAPGLIAFPDSELYAKDLMDTIEQMHIAQRYNQMLFYIEACESGSMFDGLLPNDINVYATTAANSEESSYACYFDSERQTYLGDVYSVMWMEDSDKENLNMETLHKQFLIVRKETNTSHVMQFGDNKISRESVANFQAGPSYIETEPIVLPRVPLEAVKSEDVPLSILYRKLDFTYDVNKTELIKNKIKELIKKRDAIHDIISSIVMLATENQEHYELTMNSKFPYQFTQHDCYKSAVQHYDTLCTDISTDGYARKSLRKLMNMCEAGVNSETIINSITKVCHTFLF